MDQNRHPASRAGRGGEIEVWGGVECTCNRVGDCYIDQLDLSGHPLRHADLESFAELGITALRTGLLWDKFDGCWDCYDRHLDNMRRVGLRSIAGLIHHGSGPQHTSLVDPSFPEALAAYAAAVAQRYPWIDDWTPVNEPHTTSRFSCLYRLWYPHHMSRRSYLIALLNQIRGTVLSMQAIRRINPSARLIQTDDVGRINGTAELSSLLELLGERRWLGFDLLCGRVDRHHPLFSYIRDEDIDEREILWFRDHPCPPDVLGINYYLTSDRFLDTRVHLYPSHCGSAEGPFVDVESVRVRSGGIAGHQSLIEEAWQRYRIPVAITEVHLGDRVEEQIRWAGEAWDAIRRAQADGADCAAITFWALLGSFFWNELVTRANGHYEPGVFDLRTGTPRRTELTEIVRQIANGRAPTHQALAYPGWWSTEARVLYENEELEPECEAA